MLIGRIGIYVLYNFLDHIFRRYWFPFTLTLFSGPQCKYIGSKNGFKGTLLLIKPGSDHVLTVDVTLSLKRYAFNQQCKYRIICCYQFLLNTIIVLIGQEYHTQHLYFATIKHPAIVWKLSFIYDIIFRWWSYSEQLCWNFNNYTQTSTGPGMLFSSLYSNWMEKNELCIMKWFFLNCTPPPLCLYFPAWTSVCV